MVSMAKTIIYPAAVRYLSELSLAIANAAAIGIEINKESAQTVSNLIKLLMDGVSKLSAAMAKDDFDSIEEHMQYSAQTIRPLMDKVREYADTLEGEVADNFWPLPTYQEMLFVK